MNRDIEKDLIEIECAIKSQREKDNMFTVSVLQRCYKLVSQLKEYKDLEEQNRLLKLPCAVGDTVYVLEKSQTGRVMIYQTTADSFYCAIWALDGKFGKYIFPTYAEAEAALKKLEGKEE